MADLQQVIDVLNIHNNERRATDELAIGRDIDNNILMQETNNVLYSINDSIHRLGLVLAGSNQVLIEQMNKDFGSLLKLEQKRDKASQLVREKEDKPVRPKKVKESTGGNTSLFGAAGSTLFGLGKLTAVALPLVALAAEMWLEFRGLGSGFSELRDRIASMASAVWVIGGKVLKIIPFLGRALKFIPGLGQFVTIMTSLFSGIRDAVQTFISTDGDIAATIKAGLSGAISAFINGFVGILDLFGFDTSELRGNIETAVTGVVGFIVDFIEGALNTVKRLTGQAIDLFTTSEIEADREAAALEEANLRQRIRRLARKKSSERTEEDEQTLAYLRDELAETQRRAEMAKLRARLEDTPFDIRNKYTMDQLMAMSDAELVEAGLYTTDENRRGQTTYEMKSRSELRDQYRINQDLADRINAAAQIDSQATATDEARLQRELANNAYSAGLALDQRTQVVDNSTNTNFHGGGTLSSTNDIIGPR